MRIIFHEAERKRIIRDNPAEKVGIINPMSKEHKLSNHIELIHRFPIDQAIKNNVAALQKDWHIAYGQMLNGNIIQ